MDLSLIETGNGGDLIKNPKDLVVILGFQNMIYLGMFGGNIEQSTPTERVPTQQAFDWWGNNLLMPNDDSIQMNSSTERALDTIPLTSSGRILIEDAIKADLQFLSSFINVTVEAAIISDDRLEILITLIKPDNLQSTTFIFIWDATMKELSIVKGAVGNPIPFDGRIFDYTFDFTFE